MRAPVDLSIVVMPVAPADWPAGNPYKVFAGRPHFHPRRDASGRVWLSSGKSWHVCFDGRRKITLQLCRDTMKESAGPALEGLFYMTHFAMVHRSLVLLHASAVVLNGKVCLIIGRSGIGKSTLAGCLAAMGLGHVSDDVAVLETKDGIPSACAGVERSVTSALIKTALLIRGCCLDSEMRLTLEEAIARYPHDAPPGWEARYKVWIPLGSSCGTGALRPIGFIVLPRLVDPRAEAFRLVRVPPVEALVKLTQCNVSRGLASVNKVRYFHQLALLSTRVPCVEARLRRGVTEDINRLREYLVECLST